MTQREVIDMELRWQVLSRLDMWHLEMYFHCSIEVPAMYIESIVPHRIELQL